MLDEHISMPDTQSIIAEEIPVSGKINWIVWFRLFSAPPLGISGFGLLIILFVLAEVFYDGTNYWLGICLRRSHADQQRYTEYEYIFFGLTIGTIVTGMVCTIYYFSIILNGTNYLHNQMLKGLLYTSIQFFESNPSGRILSRASNDQKIIDELLPWAVLIAVKFSLISIGSMVVISVIKPYILPVFIALVPFVVLLCRYYLPSKSQLKRLESITRSPVCDLLSSSLNGLATIRAFKVQDHFIKRFTDMVDRNTRVYINMQGAERWFCMRLNLLPCINIFATAVILVVFRHEIGSSLIALCLSYAISVPKSLQWAIRNLLEAEFFSISAERIDEYTHLPPEEDEGGHERLVKTSPEWPTDGTVQFQNYSLRHRSTLEPVLKNINTRIESGEKIGIIGRTGAGKSSLFKGILRFIDRSNIDGTILIDDIDISRITLNHLRSHLSVIPQQPILFSGTLRYNLDPFNLYSDEQCWMALEDVQLKEFVMNHSAGLLMSISESGNNLSAGQCQLICIGRAILKKSKILLIDEATSNVDKATDEIIQKTITNQFQDRTVLTIAHRLNTVAKSDRILVLDNGTIMNFDKPMNVLQHYQ
jgi:ABC-type multidrug transport system fused ATPase/permease subunit